jgi:hypothetical protein
MQEKGSKKSTWVSIRRSGPKLKPTCDDSIRDLEQDATHILRQLSCPIRKPAGNPQHRHGLTRDQRA